MMARRTFIGVLAIGAFAIVTGCSLLDRSSSYRFRMTVEAETPQGPRSGSGVLQINAMKSVAITAHEHAGGVGLEGEAVVLDLPDGPVFVLLRPVDASSTLLPVRITKALDLNVVPTDASAFMLAVRKLGSQPGRKGELPRTDWPMMVRFGDVNDPMSVELVNPHAIGVKRILLETTDNDVSTGIKNRLRWIEDKEFTLDPEGGPTTRPTFPQTIRQSAFSTEINK